MKTVSATATKAKRKVGWYSWAGSGADIVRTKTRRFKFFCDVEFVCAVDLHSSLLETLLCSFAEFHSKFSFSLFPFFFSNPPLIQVAHRSGHRFNGAKSGLKVELIT